MHDACRAISRGDLDVVLVTGAEAMYTRALPGGTRPARPLAWASQPAEATPPARPVRAGQARGHRPRDEARRAPAHPRLPPVRERPAGRQRVDAGGARAPASARCGRGSARWRPPTPRLDPHAPPGPTRSSPPDPATGWSRSPTPSSARPTCRWTRAPATSSARWRPPAPPGCPRSAGSSRWPGPTPTTTGSFRTGPSCTAPPPSGWPAPPPSSWPASGSTTSRSIDLYSCFPVVVQMAAAELGLPVDDPARPLTLTGGLTFGGGPGQQLHLPRHRAGGRRRARRPRDGGLATGLGWYATKHSIGIYASRPPAHGGSRALRLA